MTRKLWWRKIDQKESGVHKSTGIYEKEVQTTGNVSWKIYQTQKIEKEERDNDRNIELKVDVDQNWLVSIHFQFMEKPDHEKSLKKLWIFLKCPSFVVSGAWTRYNK